MRSGSCGARADTMNRQQVNAVPRNHAYPPAPDGRVLYVVGDIHGRLDLLGNVHRDIDEDKRKGPAKVCQTVEIYLGDYIDRGPDSAGVISALIARAREADCVFLRGNHEQFLLDFLAGEECLNHWRAVGAVPSLLSYGLAPALLAADAPQERVRRALAQHLPGEHMQFLSDTGSYCGAEPYLMVHAGIRPGIALQEQEAMDLLGIREEFLQFEGDFGCVVVHGHTPVLEPDFRPNRINIDTGAFATSRLTCLRIGEDGPRILASVASPAGGA
jgi:serine/threonine protein phosphatase 1